MTDTRRSATGLRLLSEGLVILVSILAALFLEGWRDDRASAIELQHELSNVGRELSRNRDIVLAEINTIDRIVESVEHLVERLEANPEARFVAVNDSVAWLATLWGPTLDPSLGAIEALISSGQLAQIDNADLRLGLAGLRDMLGDATEEQMFALHVSTDELHPRILESPDFSALRRVSQEFLTLSQGAGLSSQQQTVRRQMPTYRSIAYPNDVSIRSGLYLKVMYYEAAIAELRPLLEHFDDLVDLVAAEIQ